jgi:hypothetical protein
MLLLSDEKEQIGSNLSFEAHVVQKCDESITITNNYQNKVFSLD